MFIVGGFNVSRLGEVGAAFTKSKRGHKLSKDEVIGFCQGRISDIKVPRYVFFVEEFPLPPQGRGQKFKLREQAITEHLKRLTNR